MRRLLPAVLLLAVVGLTGCSADDPAPAGTDEPAAAGYSSEVRKNFLDSCLENARNSAGEAASDEQLAQTCECILGKVEQEYSESEFADFEERLLGGKASDEESGRLVRWSTDCAREATS